MSHIIASVTLAIPAMILAETSLSFLGLGLQPPTISWGVLLREAQNIRSIATAPWLFAPGVAVVHRGARAQLPRRRPARRRRSVQQMTHARSRHITRADAARPQRGAVILQVRDLVTHFPIRTGVVKAVDGVSFDVERGKTLCVVGESGSGKSVTARSILQIVDAPGRIVAGSMLLHRAGRRRRSTSPRCDPRGRAIRAVRGAEIAMIFQEPMSSLSPVHTVGDQIVEVLRLHLRMSKKAGARAHASSCCGRSRSRTRSARSTATRSSSRAACASAR